LFTEALKNRAPANRSTPHEPFRQISLFEKRFERASHLEHADSHATAVSQGVDQIDHRIARRKMLRQILQERDRAGLHGIAQQHGERRELNEPFALMRAFETNLAWIDRLQIGWRQDVSGDPGVGVEEQPFARLHCPAWTERRTQYPKNRVELLR
jgi:hypothetical protein